MKFQPFWAMACSIFYRRSRYRFNPRPPSIVGAQVRLEIERLEVVDHALMLALIREALCPAVPCCRRESAGGDEDVAENEDDVGPLMADDVALPWLKVWAFSGGDGSCGWWHR